MDVPFSCSCSCPAQGGPHPSFVQLDLAGAKALLNDPEHVLVVSCGSCGCQATPVDNGDSIGLVDISKPRVDSLSPNNDVLAGGAAVTISGHRLDLGTLVVKFDGTAGTNLRSRTETSAIVDAPAGTIKLVEINERQRKLEFSGASGGFQVGEIITGQLRGGQLRVTAYDPAYLMVESVRGQIDLGEQFTGANSGSLATAGTYHPDFQVGETVQGETSNATAVLQVATDGITKLLRANGFVGQFQADEWIVGLTSGARVQLSSVPQDGSVLVTVENENGVRGVGGKLYGGFTYTLL